MSDRLEFPDVRDRSLNEPWVLCPGSMVLNLYNQVQTVQDAKEDWVTTRVRRWFDKEARARGWMTTRWFQDVSHDRGPGCVMSVQPLSFGVSTEELNEELNEEVEVPAA